jgi:Glycosyl hydrolases family 43
MSTPAPPPLVLADDADLVAQLRSFLVRRVDDLAPPSGRSARTSIRERVAALHRRRRRLRHALGSSTLAAGVTAGGVQHWLVGDQGASAGGDRAAATSADTTGGPAATAPPPTAPPPTAPPITVPPPPPPAPGASWTWDPAEGVDREAADPGALFAEGRVHVFTTTAVHCVQGACREHLVPRFESGDPSEGGRLAGDAMPERPPWVASDDRVIWAPAVARMGDGYVLWFAATSGRPQDGRMKCIGAAVSATPEGPFAPRPDPLHCTPGYWAIDPYPVAHDDGWTLLWRQDDADHVTGTIVAAPLQPDGLGLAGPRTTLLTGEDPWEEGYADGRPGIGPIENPAMARHPATGEWLLTWSANLWETRDYGTGLAVCEGPLGPCQRTGTEPWLRTNASPGFATTASLGGAGGLSFVAGPDGTLPALLHAYRGADAAAPAPRVAWAYRVEAIGSGAYRLVDMARNRSVALTVNGS